MKEIASVCAIGIDVGGRKKGFHAVALRDGVFMPQRFTDVNAIVDWCLMHDARVIAIDAPCAWAVCGGSRLAERSLCIGGETIQCFKTPPRASVLGRAFYEWVFQGEVLYQQLFPHYALYGGGQDGEKLVFETFPHAIACALSGRVIPAHPKAATRRKLLRGIGYDDSSLCNIDFVDAALCAVLAERFLRGEARAVGDQAEGFILLPK